MTMQVIQHIELGSSAKSITFSSIPNTFTDLVIRVSTRADSDINSGGGIQWSDLQLQPNGSTSGLATRSLFGFGTNNPLSNTDASPSGGFSNGASTTSNTFSNCEIYIPNYTSSNSKSWSVDAVTETNGTACIRWIAANSWTGTAAISSIVLNNVTGNLVAGSSATLYGITKGSDGTTTVS